MAVVQSFPLLHLPSVPFNEVISYMKPIDQFWFSLLSKKTMQLVKGKDALNLALSLEVTDEEYGSVYHFTCKNQDGSVMPTISIADDMKKLPRIIEHLQKLESESKINLRKMKVTAYTCNSRMHRNILKTCINVPELMICSNELSYQHNMIKPNEESYFEELSAEWLTFEDIHLITKCKKIKLYELKWTSQEMNQFLQKWIASPMMRNVELTVKNMNLQIALASLPVTPQSKNLKFLGIESELRDCFEIRRKYGVKANIWIYGESLIMQTFR